MVRPTRREPTIWICSTSCSSTEACSCASTDEEEKAIPAIAEAMRESLKAEALNFACCIVLFLNSFKFYFSKCVVLYFVNQKRVEIQYLLSVVGVLLNARLSDQTYYY